MLRRIRRPVVLFAAVYAALGGVPILAAQRPVASDVRPSADTKDNEVFARPVTIALNRVSLQDALRAIARRARVEIQYQVELVSGVTKPITLQVDKAPLRTVLERVLLGTNLHAVRTSNGVTLVAGAETASVIEGGIRGIVVDAATKQPVSGVTIAVEGTKFVMRTDAKGAFAVSGVSPGSYTLVVRRLGYRVLRQSVTVPDEGTATVNVAVVAMATPLEQVVTTVTGLQRRVEVANALGYINADSLVKEAPILTLSQLLSSRVPGLSVVQGQGTVGGNVKLQIRGLSSVSLSTEPIVIVDGIRYDSRSIDSKELGFGESEPVSPLNDLNPNDIENIEVVKGPSAATLYGTDASNGVIIITTKRGKAGPARFSMYGSRDFTTIPRPVLPSDEAYYGWGTWAWDGDTTSRCTLGDMIHHFCTRDSVTHAPAAAADPRFSLFKPAQSWTSGANVSGGTEKLRYYLGGNYSDLLGAVSVPDTVVRIARAMGKSLPASFFRPNGQTMLSLQANASASPNSAVDVSVGGSYTKASTQSIQPNYGPWQMMTNNSSYMGDEIISSALGWGQSTANEENDRYTTNINGRFTPASWLFLSGTAGFDNALRVHTEVSPRDSTSSVNPTGRILESRIRSAGLSSSLGASAIFRHGWASLRSSIGTQYNRRTDENVGIFAFDLVPGATSINFAATRYPIQSYDQSVTLGSYVEEVVGINDRLFVTGAVRVDGATGFGDGYKSASYPKLGASWVLSREPWLPQVPFLDELRLRTAYGISGRQARAVAKLPSVGVVTEEPTRGLYVETRSIGNPLLRPERSAELETGLDAGLLNERFRLSLTWYRRRTEDLIISQLLPSGFKSINTNVGLVTGHGFEAQVSANLVETDPLSFSITINHAKDQTLLNDLGNALPEHTIAGLGGYAEGYPLGARFMVPVKGYQDRNGDGIIVHDGDPTLSDLVLGDTAEYLGPTQAPTHQTLTLNLGLIHRRVRISSVFDRVTGGTELLGVSCDRCRAAYDSTTPLADQFAYIKQSQFGLPVKGDFIRLREVAVATTLPEALTRSLRIRTASISLSARNLKQWTRYAGADPESAAIVSSTTTRWTANAIPQSRTWSLRCDLGL